MSRFMCSIFVMSVFACFSAFCAADITLPAMISDNMVLQQETEVNIWGWANPQQKVTVKADWGKRLPILGRLLTSKPISVSTVADDEGSWSVKLKTPAAGGPYKLVITGENEITVENILIGEVWVASGQSNMAMPMDGLTNQPIHGGPEDIAASANNSIRLFTVERVASETLLDDVRGEWLVCKPDTVNSFSAVAYYFGRKVNESTGLPVGLINSSWGGTSAEAWTREDFLKQDDELKVLVELYEQLHSGWQKRAVEAKEKGENEPPRPRRARVQDRYSSLYNGMIAPLTNMTIKGVIWYQGESNASRAYQYRKLFPLMIRNWRCDFDNPQMPFYFVQLANYVAHRPTEEVEIYQGVPRDNNWAELREAQFMANWLKNTGMAVTIDVGEANNIHPGNKKDVGERLAYWALAKDYGKDIAYSGPLYTGYFIESDKIRVKFSNTDGGLFSKDGEPAGFAIAGEDRKFVWADAVIDGDDIIVSSAKISNPVAVRYAWDTYPDNNVYNGADLPASPFRTDDWEGLTNNEQ